jgi:hypothetical protein
MAASVGCAVKLRVKDAPAGRLHTSVQAMVTVVVPVTLGEATDGVQPAGPAVVAAGLPV